MKKLLFTLAIATLTVTGSIAQKFAYVDSDYILGQIPKYKEAQSELDKISSQWQKEIEAKFQEVDKLYKNYQQEQVLLTDELKKKREAEIVTKEKEAKDLQKAKFGVDGELFKKRQELVKPIQDEIYNAVKKMAEQGNYAVIFDKSSDLTMLYTNPKYDESDKILEALGYSKKGSGK
ncbi:MAG: OmpH family outer membrane protein [Bacteroidia bacterium]